jgi:Uma2 family endonuclease
MAADAQLMTADELLLLPSGRWRYEIVRGELRRMSPSGHTHGKVAMRVGARLAAFVEAQGLGEAYAAETGFILQRSPDTVLAPDAAFVTTETLRATSLTDRGYFPGAPTLAVEVISPDENRREVAAKVAQWIAAGRHAVVVLNPRTSVATVHRPNAEVVTLGVTDCLSLPDLLPGWSLALNEIFR